MRTCRLAGALVAAAIVAGVTLTGGRAAAAGCTNFLAVAGADGARGSVASPGYLLVESADVGIPAAQTHVDSLSNSIAYAGYPWPGDTIMSALALTPLSGVYPLVARSSYPTTETSTAEHGVVTLSAESKGLSSVAEARGGGGSIPGTTIGLTRAAAQSLCGTDGTVAAIARNEAEGLSFGDGLLQIAQVDSSATAETSIDGTTTVASHMSLGRVTIAGQGAELSEAGLTFLGSTVGAPGNPAADVLEENGITVTYLAASTHPDGRGVTAPGIRVEVERHLVGSGPTVVTYTFGRAYAIAGNEPSADLGGGAALDVGVGVSSGDAVPAAGSRGSADPDRSATASRVAPLATTAGEGDGGALTTSGRPLSQNGLSGSGVPGYSSAGLYAALSAGAVILLLGAALFWTMGVRLRWT